MLSPLQGASVDSMRRMMCAAVTARPRQIPIAVIIGTALCFIAGCSRSSPERSQLALYPPSRIDHRRPAPAPAVQAPVQQPAQTRVATENGQIPKGGGFYKLGKPYQVAGRWYFPTEDPNYDRTGMASWYGADFHGRKTANGEIYDMGALTAAHPTLPIPSFAYVTSLKTQRTVLVRINDRGPYARDRIMDLSRKTAEALGVSAAGVSEVRVKYAGRAPLDGDDSAERRFLARQPWAHAVTSARSTAPALQGRMGLLGGGDGLR